MDWYARNKERIAAERREKIAADPSYLEKERKQIADRRKKYGRSPGDLERGRKKKKGLKQQLCGKARARGRKAGMEATFRGADISWPTHCPVLGIELDYTTPRGQRNGHAANLPSIDRWDNTKGYTLENVRVISLRANQLKGNATWQELMAVALYARDGILVDTP
jgi:hypothetical protein